MKLALIAAAVTNLAAGDCRLSVDGQPCTEEFRIVSVIVVDSLGAPVAGVTTSHILPRNGFVLAITQDSAANAAGRYVVLTDSQRAFLLQAGDIVRMTGVKGTARFTQDFRFDVPQGCHIRKLSGPDTVTLESRSISIRESP